MSFFPKFENLEVLDISITPADDSFLNTLGTFCTNLRLALYFKSLFLVS